jgi:hypothetical protein
MGGGAFYGFGRGDTDTAGQPFIGAKLLERQVAEGVTTPSMKAKLFEDASYYD